MAISKTLREVTQERGRLAEQKVWKALNDREALPNWVWGFRRASLEEDQKGRDLFVLTDVGEIPLQVKSSLAGADSFKRRYGNLIPVVIIASYDRPVEVIAKVIEAVEPERYRRLQMRDPD